MAGLRVTEPLESGVHGPHTPLSIESAVGVPPVTCQLSVTVVPAVIVLGDALWLSVKGTVTVVVLGTAVPPGPEALMVVNGECRGGHHRYDGGSGSGQRAGVVTLRYRRGDGYRCGIGGGPADCSGLPAVYGRGARGKCCYLRLRRRRWIAVRGTAASTTAGAKAQKGTN